MGQKNSKGGTIAINENGQVVLNANSDDGSMNDEDNYFQAHGHNHMIYSKDNKTSVNLDDFELLKVIGRGNFAKVLQVRKKDTGKIFAMKILNKTKLAESDQVEHIKTERAVMQYVEHPFLVNLLYAFQTPEKLYMVMEFVNGGELFFHLKREKRFPEPRVKFYAAELFLALDHIHKHNVVYRDLKPGGHVLLTDFGLAKILSHHDRTHTFCVVGSTEISLGNGLSRSISKIATSIASERPLFANNPGEGDTVLPISSLESMSFGPGLNAWNSNIEDVCMNGKALAVIIRNDMRECVSVTLEDGRNLILTPDHQVLAIGPDMPAAFVTPNTDHSTFAFSNLGLAKWIPAGQLTSEHRVVCSAMYTIEDEPEKDRIPEYASFKLSFNVDQIAAAVEKAPVNFEWEIINDRQRDKILAFSRICGIMQTDRASHNACLTLRDESDLQQVVADICLVLDEMEPTKWTPTFETLSEMTGCVYRIRLPDTLLHMLRRVSCIMCGNDLPDFITRADCPPSVIREFLAAYCGGACSQKSSKFPRMDKFITLFDRIGLKINDSVMSVSKERERKFAKLCGVRYNIERQCMWGAYLSYEGYENYCHQTAAPHSLKTFAEFASDIGFSVENTSRRSFALRVLSVEEDTQGVHHVYDLSVKDMKSFVANGMVVHNCGTPEYLAPEVLLQQGHGKPVDWWSYGTLLYEMLVGIPPFYSDNIQEMYDMILHADLVLPDRLISVEAQDLLARLLERNPKKRLGSGERGSDEIKYHPFFKDINWDDIYHKRISPPFLPKLKDELDTSYFDEEFTNQPPVDSFHDSGHLGESVQREFEGFTFTGKSKLAEMIE